MEYAYYRSGGTLIRDFNEEIDEMFEDNTNDQQYCPTQLQHMMNWVFPHLEKITMQDARQMEAWKEFIKEFMEEY